MNYKILFPIGLIIAVAVIGYNLFEHDEGYNTTYGESGENTALITFDTAYAQYSVINQDIVMPSASDAKLSKTGYVLLGWKTGGSATYNLGDRVSVPYLCGSTYKVTSGQTFYPVWQKLEYSAGHDITATAPAVFKTNGSSLNLTYDKNTSQAFEWAVITRENAITYEYDPHITIKNLATGNTISATEHYSASEVKCSLEGITATYERHAMKITGTTPNGVYMVQFWHKGIYANVLLYSGSGTPWCEITEKVDGSVKVRKEVPVGTAFCLPNAGVVAGTSDLAWWDCDLSGSGEYSCILPGTTFVMKEDRTFNAHNKGPGQGVMVYHFNGGSSNGLKEAEIYDVGEPSVLPASSKILRSGYKLVGWRNTADTSKVYGPGYTYLCDTDYVVMEAVWTNAATYPVEFRSGSWYYSVQNVPAGTGIATPMFSDRPDLLGWSLDGESYVEKGAAVTVSSSATYDAYNESDNVSKNHQVAFVSKGGTTSLAIQNVEDGKRAVEPEVDRSRYLFDGWYLGNGQKWDFDTPITSNIVLNARWVEAFTITYDGCDVTLKILPDAKCSAFEVEWGDGTRNSGTTHTYSENTSGIIHVSIDSTVYGQQKIWCLYSVGAKETPGEDEGGSQGGDIVVPGPVNPDPEPTPPEPKSGEDHTALWIVGVLIAGIIGFLIIRRL